MWRLRSLRGAACLEPTDRLKRARLLRVKQFKELALVILQLERLLGNLLRGVLVPGSQLLSRELRRKVTNLNGRTAFRLFVRLHQGQRRLLSKGCLSSLPLARSSIHLERALAVTRCAHSFLLAISLLGGAPAPRVKRSLAGLLLHANTDGQVDRRRGKDSRGSRRSRRSRGSRGRGSRGSRGSGTFRVAVMASLGDWVVRFMALAPSAVAVPGGGKSRGSSAAPLSFYLASTCRIPRFSFFLAFLAFLALALCWPLSFSQAAPSWLPSAVPEVAAASLIFWSLGSQLPSALPSCWCRVETELCVLLSPAVVFTGVAGGCESCCPYSE